MVTCEKSMVQSSLILLLTAGLLQILQFTLVLKLGPWQRSEPLRRTVYSNCNLYLVFDLLEILYSMRLTKLKQFHTLRYLPNYSIIHQLRLMVSLFLISRAMISLWGSSQLSWVPWLKILSIELNRNFQTRNIKRAFSYTIHLNSPCLNTAFVLQLPFISSSMWSNIDTSRCIWQVLFLLKINELTWWS